MYKSRRDLNLFIETSDVVVLVEITSVHGSTPRNDDAWMLVSEDKIFRTIGGGQLENLAIDKARALICENEKSKLEIQVPLGPHTGQCCGGIVYLNIAILDEKRLGNITKQHENELVQLPHVYIFGAGHVGKALGEALSLLPLVPILVDTRAEELSSAPKCVEKRLLPMPEMEVRNAPSGSAFIILTHDHSLDFLIAREALLRKDAAYLGMIGSKTKRATFRNWLRRENGDETDIERLTCPIGNTNVSDKRPEVIAALTAAEVVSCLHEFSFKDIDSENTHYVSGL